MCTTNQCGFDFTWAETVIIEGGLASQEERPFIFIFNMDILYY